LKYIGGDGYINMSDKEKEVTSLQALATKKLAQLYFDKISGAFLLEQTYLLPKSIFENILNEVNSDFEDVLEVHGGKHLYFHLDPEEGDFGGKPFAWQTIVLENKSSERLWFQIRPLFTLAEDKSFNCHTRYFPVSSIESNECISYDACVELSAPLTLRRRIIRREIETKGHLLIFVWGSDPAENKGVNQQRGMICLACNLLLGKNLPLNFELLMQVTNKTIVNRPLGRCFFEQKDHVKRYFFN
jgi:hypothetical protein